ncbi:MAG: sugar ABC transporter permease [Ardenticatenaceae bacterium]|nr:sugar ABC transporter permease [Ardenticatenaceae bacterium]
MKDVQMDDTPVAAAPVSERAQPTRRPRPLSLKSRQALWGYIFILPWLLGFLLFTAGPILAVFYLGFTEYSVFSPPSWVGLKNYSKIFADDPLFVTSLGNTLYYVALSVPGQIVLAFFVALLLNSRIRGLGIYRTIFYLPVIVPYVVTSVLFLWILDPQVGILKYFLSGVDLPSPQWFQSETWSKPGIVLLSLWYMGTYMLIFLAGLQGIPEHLYEAADLDGATARQKLFSITIPLMTPTIFFNLINGIINSFQVFTFAYIITKGGPLNSTLFYVLYIYRQAFEFFHMGYASALATILFVLVLGVTVLMFRWSRSWVFYEAGGDRAF